MVLLRQFAATAALLGTLLLGAASPARAALHETWFHEAEPSWEQVRRWQPLAGGKTLRVKIDSVPSVDLAWKLREAGFDRVQILTTQYPTAAALPAWRSLAESGFDLVTMVGSPPTAAQARVFNEIRFPKTLFVLTRYLEYREENPFLTLEVKYDLHFALNRYPQFMQKFALADLPLDVGIQITVDYWPRYVQMDILNLIPQSKRLRVQSIPLSAGSVPYLQNLRNVREIVFESDFDPPASQWDALERFSVRWILKGHVPTESALATLKAWHARGAAKFRLTVDLTRRPRPDEAATLASLPFDVEWTADAP